MKNTIKKICLPGFTALCLLACNANTQDKQEQQAGLVKVEGEQLSYVLPSPKTDGGISVERALNDRRSRRNFTDTAVPAEELSQILWAAYGVTSPQPGRPAQRGGLRTAPSAGALYPFEIYVLVGNVEGIEPGVYKYISEEHKIVRTIVADLREELSKAALGQLQVRNAPAVIFYSAIFERMTKKYGDRGRERYVCMDLGHSAQNIYLQAESLGLGTCAIGSFSDDEVARILQLPENEEPLYIMPIGYYQAD